MSIELYNGLSFFIFAGILVIPAILLGIMQKRIKWYGLFTCFAVMVTVLGAKPISFISLVLYCFFQLCLIELLMSVRKKGRVPAWALWTFVILSVSPLVILKLSPFLSFELPGLIGLSYMTFKSLQVIIEISDGVIKKINAMDFIYFIVFFPTILCGPIDRSRRFIEDASRIPPREEYLDMVGSGTIKILEGAVLKFVLAQLCVLIGTSNMYIYGFYLFSDFAGYSLMAIGFSYMLGIKTPDNFRHPWISTDMKDFWTRWHITLSEWLRDFVFSRLLRRFIKKKYFNGNRLTSACFCMVINMLVMGVWHGLESYYIIYGLYHGVLLALTEIYQKKSGFHMKYKSNRVYLFFSWLITFNLVMFGFYIFSGQLL